MGLSLVVLLTVTASGSTIAVTPLGGAASVEAREVLAQRLAEELSARGHSAMGPAASVGKLTTGQRATLAACDLEDVGCFTRFATVLEADVLALGIVWQSDAVFNLEVRLVRASDRHQLATAKGKPARQDQLAQTVVGVVDDLIEQLEAPAPVGGAAAPTPSENRWLKPRFWGTALSSLVVSAVGLGVAIDAQHSIDVALAEALRRGEPADIPPFVFQRRTAGLVGIGLGLAGVVAAVMVELLTPTQRAALGLWLQPTDFASAAFGLAWAPAAARP